MAVETWKERYKIMDTNEEEADSKQSINKNANDDKPPLPGSHLPRVEFKQRHLGRTDAIKMAERKANQPTGERVEEEDDERKFDTNGQLIDSPMTPRQRTVEATSDSVDGGWGWMVVLGGFFVYWLVPGMIRSYGAIHVEILETFRGCTETEASWIPALLASCAVGLAPVSAVLGKMYSCRNVVFIGGLLCCLGLSLSFFATSIFHLYITMGLITGIGSAMTTMPSIIAVNMHFKKKRALAIGTCLSGVSLGSFTIPPLVKVLVSLYNFHGAMLILGAGIAHLCACALLFTPNGMWFSSRDQQKFIASGSKELAKSQTAIKPLLFKSDAVNLNGSVEMPSISYCSSMNNNDQHSTTTSRGRGERSTSNSRSNEILTATIVFLAACFNFRLFKKLSFTLSIVCCVCIAGAHPHVLVYIPAYAMTLGMSKGDAGMLLSISSLVDLLNRIIYGHVTDLEILKRPYMLAISCFAIAVGTICVPLVSSYVALAICTSIISVGIGTTFTLFPVILSDNHGVESLHSTYGMLRLCQGLFMLVMAPVTGGIKDNTGYYQLSFFVMGAIVLGGVVAMLFMPCALRYDKKKERQQQKTADPLHA